MIGHGLEVEGAALELDLVAARVLDRLTLGEPVGVVGIRPRPEQVGVEGVLRVHVQVAEVGVLERVRRRAVAGDGSVAPGVVAAGGAAEEREREDGDGREERASLAHDDLLWRDCA